MKTFALVLLLLTSYFALASDNSAKPAWELTLDERLAARTNATGAAERIARHARSARHGARVSTAAWADVIDGNVNPELFLPTELFQSVVRRGFVGETWRDAHQQDLEALQLPADFWDRLERVAGPFIGDLRQQEALLVSGKEMDAAGRAEIDRRLAASYPTLCRHRADALAAARAEFGPLLDRFMYEYVVRGQVQFAQELADGARLRAEERGCR
ncbi:MAG TPA: hypothetical protein VGF69_13145 [Thermoanaerobaculia bacterium]|jgi:hypothetical protein